jgi:hypothetical protein
MDIDTGIYLCHIGGGVHSVAGCSWLLLAAQGCSRLFKALGAFHG